MTPDEEKKLAVFSEMINRLWEDRSDHRLEIINRCKVYASALGLQFINAVPNNEDNILDPIKLSKISCRDSRIKTTSISSAVHYLICHIDDNIELYVKEKLSVDFGESEVEYFTLSKCESIF